MASEEAELRELILEIYDAAIDPRKWPVILDRIACFVGARGAMLFDLETKGSERILTPSHMSVIYEPYLVKEYLRLHQQQELEDQDRFAFFSKKTDGIELISDHVLADSYDDVRNRPNAVMLRKLDIHHRCGALLSKDNVNRHRFSMQFAERHGPLNAEDSRKMALLLPHIAKALDVSRPVEKLHEQFNIVLSYLDLLNVGVCFLGGDGQILLKNLEFQRQMETYPVYRVSSNGRLLFNDPETDSAVRRLMEDIGQHGHFGARPRKEAVTALLDREDYRLCIEVLPLNRLDDLQSRPVQGHVVYSLDTRLPMPLNTPFIAKLFELTGTESDVLSLIAEGLTNREISERRTKSVETVNSQTKSILSKTMTTNRTQLIRLVTNLSANFLCSLPPQRFFHHQDR